MNWIYQQIGKLWLGIGNLFVWSLENSSGDDSNFIMPTTFGD